MKKYKNCLINYIKTNIKSYCLVMLLFLIGVFIGVLIVNNCDFKKLEGVSSYLSEFAINLKNNNNLDKIDLIRESIRNNLFFAITLWLAGTTVIGIPVVLAVILYRGVTLGYTISAFAFTFGKIKGLIFCLITLLLQNLLFIPAILTIGVSSINLYKAIVKEKENIKLSIIKHSVISGLMIFMLILSSTLEGIVSIPILQNFLKIF